MPRKHIDLSYENESVADTAAADTAAADTAGDNRTLDTAILPSDALEGVPLCAIRGANSDLLSEGTFAEMKARRPDMIATEVPGRGHVPFLDEPEALDALGRWIAALG